MRHFKYILVSILLLFSIPGHAQNTTALQLRSGGCVNQYSFYCPSVPVTLTINGQSVSGTMSFDMFTYSYGSLYFSAPNFYSAAQMTLIQIKAKNSMGFPTQMSVSFSGTGDPNFDNDLEGYTGTLELNVTWTSRSSGGGRGSHNVIWLPAISGTGMISTE